MKSKSRKAKTAALVGVGFDGGEEDETRLSRGKNFVLLGGSAETHAQMQETALKVNERLDLMGKRLEDVTVHELRDLFDELTG